MEGAVFAPRRKWIVTAYLMSRGGQEPRRGFSTGAWRVRLKDFFVNGVAFKAIPIVSSAHLRYKMSA